MRRLCSIVLPLFVFAVVASAESPKTETKKAEPKKAEAKLEKGSQAPEFKIKDSKGNVIDLAELTAKGPVLVRLTCGCSGCDKELAYFQKLHEAYKDKGLVSIAVFKEADAKVAEYVKSKKLDMRYAVDTKGESWKTFKTTTMPTNILIDKGGKVVAVVAGCEPSGLLAMKLSEKVAETIKTEKVDVQKKVKEDSKNKK